MHIAGEFTSEKAPERLRAAREHRGLTIAGAAEATGLSPTTIRRLEAFASDHTRLDTLRAVGVGYRVSIDWIWGKGPDDAILELSDEGYRWAPIRQPAA